MAGALTPVPTVRSQSSGSPFAYRLARASDSILPLMRVVTGAIENEARRDKARAAYARRRAQGLIVPNKRPYGIRLENGKDVANEPQAAAVRIAYELAANGFGLNAIGKRLRAIAPPKCYANGRVHETEWVATRVAQLLKNPAYRETVVDPDTWHTLARHRRYRRGPLDRGHDEGRFQSAEDRVLIQRLGARGNEEAAMAAWPAACDPEASGALVRRAQRESVPPEMSDRPSARLSLSPR